MLKLFEVTGFKNFEKSVKLDFSDIRNYEFNADCINDNILGKIIIYGKNAIGKSNFGLALCDVTLPKIQLMSVTQGDASEDYYDPTYLNSSNKNEYAEFRYVFSFDENEIEYVYRKDSFRTFVYEKVKIDDELIFEYDRNDKNNRYTEGLRKLSDTLVLDFDNIDSSILMYAKNNMALEDTHPLKQTADFIMGMQFVSSVGERRLSRLTPLSQRMMYSPRWLYDSKENLKELQNLLDEAEINMLLEIKKDDDGRERLYAKSSENASSHLFHDVASSGTIALYNFFRLYKSIQKYPQKRATVIFLDEFDAFYHVELAETIVNLIKKLKNIQVIFTSHNTSLLSNRIMRPDCFFILTQNKLTSFVNATDRELREGHNLEKLYKSGEFDEET